MKDGDGEVGRANLGIFSIYSCFSFWKVLQFAVCAYVVDGGVRTADVGLGDLQSPEHLDDPGGRDDDLVDSEGSPEDSHASEDLGDGADDGLLSGEVVSTITVSFQSTPLK